MRQQDAVPYLLSTRWWLLEHTLYHDAAARRSKALETAMLICEALIDHDLQVASRMAVRSYEAIV